MSQHIVIVGGGLSGLAAAVDLVSRGIRVTLLEQKPALGGRAYSFRDNVTGDTIDNGQHVLLGGYERTMHFLKTIGTRHLLRVQPSLSLTFHHPQRGFQEFRLPLLPPPFNLVLGILSCSLFSFSDRVRILRAGSSLRFLTAADEHRLAMQTIAEWLRSVGQSGESVHSFWQPLAVSMMNERIEKASALVFVLALRKAFWGGGHNAALAIPSVGLSQLYVDGARQFITLRGGEIQCNADVSNITVADGHASRVLLRDNSVLTADAVILAVPHNKVLPILPPQLKEKFSNLTMIDVAPIVSIHLWFNQEFMRQESAGLIGRRIQWLFNRRLINREQEKGGHVSAVISGAYDFVDRSKDELVKIAVEDIRSVYPRLSEEPWHAVVVREKNATYASGPAVESLRPPAATEIPNLFLAGDWTATRYPATIEGAVLSGERAAMLVLKYLGRID